MERIVESANEDLQSLINKKKTLVEYLVNNCVSVGDWKNAAIASNDLRELEARIDIMLRVKNVVTQLIQQDNAPLEDNVKSIKDTHVKAVKNPKDSSKKGS